jgi:arylsulfatase A-like enzyme
MKTIQRRNFIKTLGISTLGITAGMSLLPDLVSGAIYFVRRAGYNYSGLCYYAVRKGDYKLVQNSPFEEFQLFNIKKDPHETTPLNDKPTEFHKLSYELSQHIRRSGAIPWQEYNVKQ